MSDTPPVPQTSGSLEPPRRDPPTAVGTETPPPPDRGPSTAVRKPSLVVRLLRPVLLGVLTFVELVAGLVKRR